MIPYEFTRYVSEVVRDPEVSVTFGAARPRLNVALPHVLREFAFGGVVSALELARHIGRHYEDIRFLSLAPLDGRPTFDLTECLVRPGEQRATLEAVPEAGPLACHEREVFLCTYWPSVLLWEAYERAMAGQGRHAAPFYYFIQDFEPGFYPFGAKHARSLATYGHGERCVAVFNSSSLAAHFDGLGLAFSRGHVLKPSLNPALRAYLEERGHVLPPKPEDRIAILAYGRPEQPRNCFPVILEGLRRFVLAMPEAGRGKYMLLSAGQPHEDILLAPGAPLKSLGKLPIERYAAVLSFAHVGVSLMVSPHPSYPPLEMAAFGLVTITNRFGAKDISASHPLIASLDLPEPAALARELPRAVERAKALLGRPVRSEIPDCMDPRPWAEGLAELDIEAIPA